MFVTAALNLEHNTFIVHVAFLSSIPSLSSTLLNADVHLSCKSQIADLIAKKALTKVFAQYVNFVDIFSPDLVYKLPKYTKINDHAIKLLNDQ